METENRYKTVDEPEYSVILKYIRNTASEEERGEVDAWLKEDPENEKALLQIARIYHADRTHKRIASRDAMKAYMGVERRIGVHKKVFWLKKISVAAACFLAGLIISSVISSGGEEKDLLTSQIITVRANAGMRTHFNLPDGTVAYLNSGSTISYPLPYDKKERRIKLEGEAYFKVAHNPDQPFIVSVKDDKMRVKVLGTEFNLQSYEDDEFVQTTLVKGSVNIELVKQGSVFSEINLRPSEKAVYKIPSGIVSILSVDTDYETAWKEGRLMFKDMPLPQVLKKLAYFYNVRFEVQDSVINSYCFTGTFENKQLSQVLDYLKISSQIDYVIRHATTDDSLGTQYTTVILKKRK